MRIFSPNIAQFLPRANPDPISPATSKEQQDLELGKLKKACQDFEAIFISFMLKSMHKAGGKSDMFGSGLGGDIYRQIFDEKLSESMAQSGQLRIGDILFSRYASMITNEASENAAFTTAAKPGIEQVMIEPLPDRTGTFAPILKSPVRNASKPGSGEREGEFVSKYEHIIEKAAGKFGIKPSLIKSVIKHESGGNPMAISSKGAKGLMQLVDSTATMMGVTDLFNPVQNIMGGTKYLSILLKRFKGDLTKAVASYNAGPAAVEKYNGVPPYPETQKYVRNVISSMMSD